MNTFCFQYLEAVSKITSRLHSSYSKKILILWGPYKGARMIRCDFLFRGREHELLPVCPEAVALLIHAWLDWMHTYLHLMNSEASCAECRRGHRSCSGVSCVPVCCAEIRRLSGPVTVYSIIFGDGGRGEVFISLLSSRAAPSYSTSSSVCLIQHGVLMVHACSMSRLFFCFFSERKSCISACPRCFVSMTTVL